jgi:hypothetical protein
VDGSCWVYFKVLSCHLFRGIKEKNKSLLTSECSSVNSQSMVFPQFFQFVKVDCDGEI